MRTSAALAAGLTLVAFGCGDSPSRTADPALANIGAATTINADPADIGTATAVNPDLANIGAATTINPDLADIGAAGPSEPSDGPAGDCVIGDDAAIIALFPDPKPQHVYRSSVINDVQLRCSFSQAPDHEVPPAFIISYSTDLLGRLGKTLDEVVEAEHLGETAPVTHSGATIFTRCTEPPNGFVLSRAFFANGDSYQLTYLEGAPYDCTEADVAMVNEITFALIDIITANPPFG